MRAIEEFVRRLFVALRSRYYIAYYRFVHGVEFGPGVRVYSRLIIHGPGKVIVGAGTCFSSRRAINELCTMDRNAVIRIGAGCLMNGAVIGCARSVTIGDRCILAEVYVRDTSSHGPSAANRHLRNSAIIAPVTLGENVWVGSHAHVMPGVHVGDNTVIGVNSVVTKSLPADVFAAGCPAVRVKELPEDPAERMEAEAE